MFKPKAVFNSFSVDDIDAAQKFYTKTLKLKADKNKMGLRLHLPGGGGVFVYQKTNHEPATFTILNFIVANIDATVEELTSQGITFERYKELPADEKGIMRGISENRGPDIAWFKDPAGNILSIIQES